MLTQYCAHKTCWTFAHAILTFWYVAETRGEFLRSEWFGCVLSRLIEAPKRIEQRMSHYSVHSHTTTSTLIRAHNLRVLVYGFMPQIMSPWLMFAQVVMRTPKMQCLLFCSSHSSEHGHIGEQRFVLLSITMGPEHGRVVFMRWASVKVFYTSNEYSTYESNV